VRPLATVAHNIESTLNDRYRTCAVLPCDNSIESYSTQAIVDSTYSSQQYQRRRYERRLQLKRGVIQKAHASTLQAPGNVFQLFEQAASIYSTLFQNAQQNLTGATSSLGYGLGSLGGVFSRGI
jgi:hypothetical protein